MSKPLQNPNQDLLMNQSFRANRSVTNLKEKGNFFETKPNLDKNFVNVGIETVSKIKHFNTYEDLKDQFSHDLDEKSNKTFKQSDCITIYSSSVQVLKKTEFEDSKQSNVLANLHKGMMDIGFKHVEIEEDYVTFSVNSANSELENRYMIFDLLLSTKQNDEYIVMKSFYSEDEEKYKFSKLFIPYFLKFINLINRKLKIGGFYFDFPNGYLYFEISQIYYKNSKEIHKICCKLTDEVVMVMSAYSKAIFALNNYLKSFKHLLKVKNCGVIEFKSKLKEEIKINTIEFLKKSNERYEFLRKRDTNFSWVSLADASNSEKELRFMKKLEKKSLDSLMLYSKYKISPEDKKKLRIPQYSLVNDSKYCSLKSTLERKPGMIKIIQELLLELLEAGFTFTRKTDLLGNFITTNDEFIFLNLSNQRQLSDILIEVPESEKKIIKSAYLNDIKQFALEQIEKEHFDLSIMNTDFSELLMKVE